MPRLGCQPVISARLPGQLHENGHALPESPHFHLKHPIIE